MTITSMDNKEKDMSELDNNTPVEGETTQPVHTDTDAETIVEAKSELVDAQVAPVVEIKDNKTYVNGVRTYSRDETNRIAVSAKREAESKFLEELGVDSMDAVKSVVKQLQNTPAEGNLNLDSLKATITKKEQTVEELRAELSAVKTDFALREHVSNLKDSMPAQWKADQKSAVVDLMKARDMLHFQEGTFAIKNGEDFFTTDGETPDYKTAVETVGQQLGLSFAKEGIKMIDAEKTSTSKVGEVKGIDESALKTDPNYRRAYVSLRDKQRLSRNQINDALIKKTIKDLSLTPESMNSKALR